MKQRGDSVDNSSSRNLTNEGVTLSLQHPKQKNIGANIVLKGCCSKKKYVVGTYDSFWVFVLTVLGITITVSGWMVSTIGYCSNYFFVIGFVLYVFTIFYMSLCFLVEPGIIPKNDPDYQYDEPPQTETGPNEKETEDENGITPSIFKEKYCTTCKILRPPKTSHCRICDNCVQNFDQ